MNLKVCSTEHLLLIFAFFLEMALLHLTSYCNAFLAFAIRTFYVHKQNDNEVFPWDVLYENSRRFGTGHLGTAIKGIDRSFELRGEIRLI